MTRDDPSAFAPPPSFGPFRVLHQIGIGALGPVFRTYEPTRDRLIAVKVFRLDITPEQAQALADELSHAAEAALFHPSIVEPIAAGVEGTVAYRAEEYVAAESLDAAMRHYAPASLEKALPFITQLAGAIDFARSAGIGHGALHLRDVFVTPDEARASGFGVVEALERVGLRAPVRRPYSAPERIAGEGWGTPADVFSLAAIAYELLTARRPAGIGEEIGTLSGDNVGPFAEPLRAVLARAMDDNPERRYQSALAFASALEAAGRGERSSRPADVASASAAVVPVSAAAETLPLLAPPTASFDDEGIGDERRPDTDAFRFEGSDAPAAGAGLISPLAGEWDHAAEDELDGAVAEFPAEAAPAAESEFDDVEAERDSDAAHFEWSRAESDAPPRFEFGAGEDPEENAEAAADLALDAPETSRYSDEFTLLAPAVSLLPGAARARDEERARDEVNEDDEPERPVYTSANGMPVDFGDDHDARRPRVELVSIAIALVVGLMLGFAAGRAMDGPGTTATTDVTQGQRGSQAPDGSAPPQRGDPGQAYSDQRIDRSAAARPGSATPPAAQPPASPPAVPGDGPKAPAAAPATTGSIVVRSTPSRASVTVNGRWRGRTPVTVALPLGNYTVRIVQPGYAVAREDFRLTASEPVRNLSFRLTRAGATAPSAARTPSAAPGAAAKFSGSLYVDSRPRGARVVIDGRPTGTTPARIPEIPIGSHVVRLELPDHRVWSDVVRIVAGQEARVSGSLDRIR